MAGGEENAIAIILLLATQTSLRTTMEVGREGISRRSPTRVAIWVLREVGVEEGRGGGEGGGGGEGEDATGDTLLDHPTVVSMRERERRKLIHVCLHLFQSLVDHRTLFLPLSPLLTSLSSSSSPSSLSPPPPSSSPFLLPQVVGIPTSLRCSTTMAP